MANRTLLQKALQNPYDCRLFAKDVLKPVFDSAFTFYEPFTEAPDQPTKGEASVIDSVLIYGKIDLEDGTEVTCYEIKLQPKVRIEQNRVAIQQYVRKMLLAGQAALINFVAPATKEVWRFTLVAKDSTLTDEGIKEKTTQSKRYTYLLGPSETCKTAAECFETLSMEKLLGMEALQKAFSVEKLSDAFFDEYKLHYDRFVDSLIQSNFIISVFDADEKAIRDFAKKMLGRIVFLYFVQKKRWLGASSTDYTDGNTNFLMDLFHEAKGNDSFYPSYLSPLFFETLNKERPNEDFKMPDGKTVKIPFLNGGLFDKEDIDGKLLTFSPKLFHNRDYEEIALTKKTKATSRGFLDFLNAYNFTVFEDSPNEHTVAVDPEMLGHIFENLLEDNKDKGAFYTPKEIVHYMCQESLIEYLTTHLSKEYTVYRPLGKDQVELFGNESRKGQLQIIEELGDKALNRADVEVIVKNKDISRLSAKQLTRMSELLDTVKICDPAIGSGAFPMGLLQEMVAIKEVIHYQLNNAMQGSSPSGRLGGAFHPATVKENIIQNSIYGVDIEKGAVDIARLRFWLSLVVDEEKPRALPNLDYKIVVGNSLVPKLKIDGIEEIVELNWNDTKSIDSTKANKEAIQQLLPQISKEQIAYFNPENKDKVERKARIRELKLKLLEHKLTLNRDGYINRTPEKTGVFLSAKDHLHNLERQKTTAHFDSLLKMFVELKKHPETSFEYFDWYLDFPELLNQDLVKSDGGFDIVIGNPPYGAKLSSDEKALFKQLYFDVHMRTPDSFNYFISKSLRILNGDGVLSFIVPNNLLFQNENSKSRELLINKHQLKSVINLGDNTFENADVPTCIFVALKKFKENYRLQYSDFRNEHIKNIPFFSPQSIIKRLEINQVPGLVLGMDSHNIRILKLIETLSWKIDEIALEVARGIDTGKDEIFRIPRKLAVEKGFEDELLRSVLVGGDMDKFKIVDSDYLLIYTSRTTKIDDYPNIKEYLLQSKEKLQNRGEAKQGIMPWFALGRQRNPELFEEDKIILRQTSDSIRAAYDKHKFYTLNSTLILKLKTDSRVLIKFVLVVLNSRLNNYVYKNLTQEEGRTFAEVKPNNVRKLFVPKISIEEQAVFEVMCDYLMFLYDSKNDPLSPLVPNTHIAKIFEEVVDGCVYEIYFKEHMKERNIDILDRVRTLFKPIDSLESKGMEPEIINDIFNHLRKSDNQIRSRIQLFVSSSPEFLKEIIQQ
jgi:adenine-specific DNA-methyltransferase